MRYLGGKATIGKEIADFIHENYIFDSYVEPFCGMCGVARHIKAKEKICSDSNEYIIALLKRLQGGWVPPSNLSEVEYNEIKQHRLSYPKELVAIAGYGCSFGAKWFGGYARSKGRNYCQEAHKSLLKLKPLITDIQFKNLSYTDLQFKENCVIYCDPPYANTTKIGKGETFDSIKFWGWVRKISETYIVLVSEFQAPEDFKSVWSLNRKLDMNPTLTKIEHLFTLKGGKGDI